MRIAIDARSYGTRHFTGVGRYIEELIHALEDEPGPHDYTVVLCDLNADEYVPGHPSFRRVVCEARPYTFREQVVLPRLLRHLRPDLVHFPANFGPLAWTGTRITTVHDLSMLEHPPVLHAGLRGQSDLLRVLPARLAMWRGIRASNRVLTGSQTAAETIRYRYHVDADAISIAYQGVRRTDSDEERRPEAVPDGPFLLTVGLAYPHKNLHRLLDAFALVRAAHPEMSLIIAGRADAAYQALRQGAIDRGLETGVRFPGRVEEAELLWLYRNAALYVFPSLSEGFGLPGLEAMGQGTPVIAARASCLPEVYGDAAAYLCPTDHVRMASDICDVLEDPAEMSRLSVAGPSRAAQYTWSETAARTLDAYSRTVPTHQITTR